MEKQWEFDRFHEDSYELAKNAEINKYKSFLQIYSKNLYNIEEVMHKFPYRQFGFDLDPINLESLPYEQGSLLQLIKTDNKVLNKIVTVFAALCCEIDFLIKEGENKYCWTLLLYGEGPVVNKETGENLILMGRFISFLQELNCFVKRCYEVVRNVLHQLNAFFSTQKASFRIDTTEMHLKQLFSSLGHLLRVLTTIDSIVMQQAHLKDDWNAYKRMIKNVHHNPTKFSIDTNKFYRYEKHLAELEGQLLDGNIYQNCVEQIFDDKLNMVSKNSALATEFSIILKLIYDQVEPNLGENSTVETRLNFVVLCTLSVLHNQIYRNFDKKFFKSIWDMNKKCPVVMLSGGIVCWFSNDFLLTKMPNVARMIEKNPEQANQTNKQTYYQAKIQTLSKTFQKYYGIVNGWLIKMQSLSEFKLETLISYEQTFMQGVEVASFISNLISTILNLSFSLETPMTKSCVLELGRLIELIKAIQIGFHEKKEFIVISKQYFVQLVNRKLLAFIQAARKRIVSDKKYSEKKLDILSGLVLAGNSLNGPPTRERLLIANFGLAISNRLKTFKQEENVDDLLKRLEAHSFLETRIKNACDTSFLYWHYNVLIPFHLTDIYENTNTPDKIHYIILALRDCIDKFVYCRHNSHEIVTEKYLRDLLSILNDKFLHRLCRDIETDLRLSIHLELKSDQSKLFKDGLKDLSKFVNIPPIYVFNKYVNIKQFVKKYLDRTFYDLTTIALHDWKAYSEMRNLASQKYNLHLTDPYLPSSTLEQGLDVLEIMRNIHVFVTRYLYNLNNQIFVEKSSQNKHLNTINIRHIANSIRTHGIGIMNTTVNFTYQYLRKQFYVFSQFLFDEHIKAKLIKDITFFKESKVSLDQKYPYERAEKFNRSIRKLGLLQDNQTYLDQFRQLISQIGNALGYVRMIRSGGLNYCSNTIRFVPDLDDIVSFEQYSSELKSKLSDQTVLASKNLDLVTNNLVKNFSESTDFFRILVDVFANEFRSNKNMHLKNFYIILPSLTLNYIEYMIGSKEKINKKNSTGAAFTDDGFAMGIAYILRLLNQYNDFDSLHWFQSVREKFNANKESIANQQKTQQIDDKLMQTQALTMQRYATYLKEFDLLQFALSSARIFFRGEKETVELN